MTTDMISASYVDDASFGEMIDALRKFVWMELVPKENLVEESGKIPPEIIQQMADL